ncbi:MAG: TIGR03936 family radical SAM-associated protein [Chloroflexota bacterium]
MRLRITFAKQDALRYTGHLDLHRIWERAARRAELPLAYSQGFHPQPKISLASALPLGFSSTCEVLDMRLVEDLPLEGLKERIQAAVPTALKILDIQPVDEKLPALQTLVAAAEYRATLTEPADGPGLTQKAAEMLAASSLPRERRGKAYDLRPLIEQVRVVVEPQGRIHLTMRLSARDGATGRPEELLDQLDIPAETVRVERTRLIFAGESVE